MTIDNQVQRCPTDGLMTTGDRAGSHATLIVGDPVPGGLTGSLVDGFRDLGWTVERASWEVALPRPFGSIALRAPALGAELRRRLRRDVRHIGRQSSFQLVVVVKGAASRHRHDREPPPGAFSCPVVCWNPDSPFDFALSNSGAGIAGTISSYDAYVTWADDVAVRLREHVDPVMVVPFGYDPRLHFPCTGDGHVSDRVVFIGSWTRQREEWLTKLRKWRPIVFGDRGEPSRYRLPSRCLRRGVPEGGG